MTIRIAMWSGPRNISTAMMRSFEARGDCAVSDEPYYGAYLKHSGEEHPMGDAIIADMDCDWHSLTQTLTGDSPNGEPIWYQKHMIHHMTGPVAPDALTGCRHVFLIRDPARIVASYRKKMTGISAKAIGLVDQRHFFDREADRLGHAPPVIDGADVLADPAGVLEALCAALGIGWTSKMLSWPAGRRASDGVWAPHWYDRVEASTGFEPPVAQEPPVLDAEGQATLAACVEHYDHMRRFALAAQA